MIFNAMSISVLGLSLFARSTTAAPAAAPAAVALAAHEPRGDHGQLGSRGNHGHHGSGSCAPVTFNSTWPSEFVGSESYILSWSGGCSGRYSLAWVEEYNIGIDYLLNFVFQNETYSSYDFYFAPAKCWPSSSTFQFLVFDGNETYSLDLQHPVIPTSVAVGPKLALVAGDDEDGVC